MRKIFIFNLICIYLFIFNGMSVTRANEVDTPTELNVISTEIEYLEDGYLIYTVSELNDNITLLSDTYTKTSQKTVTKYNSNDEVSWIYVLEATYSIDAGVSSYCIWSDYSITINNDSWKFSDGNSYYNDNVAYGEGVFKHKTLFITTQTVNIDISLTCDVNGNVS